MVDLGSEGQVVEEFKCRFESVKFISAIFESPEVVVCVPRVLSLIMIRDCIQRSSVLTAVSRDDADDMGIGTHDRSSKVCRYTPSPIVSDDTGCIVSPAIVVKA